MVAYLAPDTLRAVSNGISAASHTSAYQYTWSCSRSAALCICIHRRHLEKSTVHTEAPRITGSATHSHAKVVLLLVALRWLQSHTYVRECKEAQFAPSIEVYSLDNARVLNAKRRTVDRTIHVKSLYPKPVLA